MVPTEELLTNTDFHLFSVFTVIRLARKNSTH